MADTIKRMHEYLNKGDFVVGSYNNMGTQIKPGGLMGDPTELNEFQHLVLESAARTKGAEAAPIPQVQPSTKKKKTRLKKQPAVDINPPPLITLQQLEDEETSAEKTELENNIILAAAKEIVEAKLKDVVIHIDGFGKLKMKVEDVLESDMAYAFVFAKEEDIIFTPQAGQTLNITLPDGEMILAYYPDTLFTWIDNKKKIMVLFKQPSEEAE